MSTTIPYLLSIKPIKRSSNKSVVNIAAYIGREKLKDLELNKTFNYTRNKHDMLYSKIFTPELAPSTFQNKSELWNAVTQQENRVNSQLAKVIELSLPYQLTLKQMKNLINEFVLENFIKLGMIADVAIHAPPKDGDHRNYHAHVLLTLRKVNEYGSTGNKVREWNEKSLLYNWRRDLALKCAKELEKANHFLIAPRWEYSYTTLEKQYEKAIERKDYEYAQFCVHQPNLHKGTKVHALEKKGQYSYMLEKQQEIHQKTLQKKNELDHIQQLEYEYEYSYSL
jgi:hypothetical protein